MSKHKLSDAERAELLRSEELQRQEQELLSRKSDRLKMEAKITLRSQTNFFVGFSENISEGGIFISTQSPPDVGDSLEVDIPLIDGSQTITIKGIVRWHRFMANGNPSGCGVQFLDMPAGADHLLQNMITLLQKEPLFIDL